MKKLFFLVNITFILCLLNQVNLLGQKSSNFYDDGIEGEQVSKKFLLHSKDFPTKSVNLFVVRTKKQFKIRINLNFGFFDLTDGDEIWFVNKDGGRICYINMMKNQERLFETRAFGSVGPHIGDLLKVVLHGESYYFAESESTQFFQVVYEASQYVEN